MVTNLSLDLSEDQRLALGKLITGKANHKATRKEIKLWAEQTLAETLDGPRGSTRLVNMPCPKCHKPISVPVPIAKAEPAQQALDVAPSLNQGRDNLSHALNAAHKDSAARAAEATRKAIDNLVKSLGDLKETL